MLRLNVPVNIFHSCRKRATASWVLPVLSESKVSCSRTQHGGGGFRTPDLSLRSQTLYHWPTMLPRSVMSIGTMTITEFKSVLQIKYTSHRMVRWGMCFHSSVHTRIHWESAILLSSVSHTEYAHPYSMGLADCQTDWLTDWPTKWMN